MRPRVFPAEDAPCSAMAGRCRAASMRPRVFPAEDTQVGQHGNQQGDRASMRPRVFPAEDLIERQFLAGGPRASMRPRVFPAEDGATPRPAAAIFFGFNEAAGIPRGRLEARAEGPCVRQVASMRPRVFPAEDPAGFRRRRVPVHASMRPRVFPAEDVRRP